MSDEPSVWLPAEAHARGLTCELEKQYLRLRAMGLDVTVEIITPVLDPPEPDLVDDKYVMKMKTYYRFVLRDRE